MTSGNGLNFNFVFADDNLTAEAEETAENSVIYTILANSETPITRNELARWSNMSDRSVRREISRLRENGVLICNAQNGEGYYIANDRAELEKQYRQDYGRAMSILKRMKAERRLLKLMGVNVQ